MRATGQYAPQMPFDRPGVWLRCQLHAHTTRSDGESTVEGLVEHYARARYDVLAITDHWELTRAEHAEVVLVPASELSARTAAGGEADVLAYGIETLPEPREEFPSIAEAARWIVGAGGVAFLAHPYWSGLVPDDYLGAPDLAGLEVWNAGSELNHGNGLSAVHWDDVLHRGARCTGIATDDSHYPGYDSRLAWTWVRAAERTPAAVVAALREGAFYASYGPSIEDVRVVDGGVEVACSPARSVLLRSGPWDGCTVHADRLAMDWRGRAVERTADGLVVRARFELPEWWAWGRVEVVAPDGSRAWSNPFPLPRPTEGGTDAP